MTGGQAAEGTFEDIRRARLLEDRIAPGTLGSIRFGREGRVAGHGQDRHRPGTIVLAQPSGQFETIDAGDVEIDNDEVGTDLERPFERLQAVVGLLDVEPGTAQPLGAETAPLQVVFHQQDGKARGVLRQIPLPSIIPTAGLGPTRRGRRRGTPRVDGGIMNQGSLRICPGLIWSGLDN